MRVVKIDGAEHSSGCSKQRLNKHGNHEHVQVLRLKETFSIEEVAGGAGGERLRGLPYPGSPPQKSAGLSW